MSDTDALMEKSTWQTMCTCRL